MLQSFHEVAYFADDRQDLLNGINEFLDYSIVIPPSDIEGKDLLKTVVEFQKQMLRKRKERELQKNHSFTGMEQNNKGCLSNSQSFNMLFNSHQVRLYLLFLLNDSVSFLLTYP